MMMMTTTVLLWIPPVFVAISPTPAATITIYSFDGKHKVLLKSKANKLTNNTIIEQIINRTNNSK